MLCEANSRGGSGTINSTYPKTWPAFDDDGYDRFIKALNRLASRSMGFLGSKGMFQR